METFNSPIRVGQRGLWGSVFLEAQAFKGTATARVTVFFALETHLIGNDARMFRMDRFLTLHFFYPLIRSKLIKRNNGIPILMYHSISDETEPGLHPYYQINTSRNTFAKHMKFLSENGYSVLPLRVAVDILKSRSNCDQKPVVLTFDDGFSDFHTEAFPILQAYGYPCTVFLATAFVDNHNWTFKGKNCLSWDEVRELHHHGVAFGSHTVTHPELVALNTVAIETELDQSKKRIETELHESVESFSYPFAFPEQHTAFTRRLRKMIQAAGYSYGVTTRIGISDGDEDPIFLKRIPVNEFDDTELLNAKLYGAYSWTHIVQRSFKLLRARFKNGQHRPARQVTRSHDLQQNIPNHED